MRELTWIELERVDPADERAAWNFIKLRCPACKEELFLCDRQKKPEWYTFFITDVVCECGHVLSHRLAHSYGLIPNRRKLGSLE